MYFSGVRGNPYAAELLRTIFHSSEAGIANAMSKNNYIYKEINVFKILFFD